MDMGKVKTVRKIAEPMTATPMEKPIIAPIFTTPEKAPAREPVAVPVKREEDKA